MIDNMQEMVYSMEKMQASFRTKIKVLLLSAWYPLTMSRYFERAFRRREDVDLLTCGHYSGQFIPWQGGMNLPMKYAIPPDISVSVPPNAPVPYDLVKHQLPKGWIPDIVINVDAGQHWTTKPSDGLVVHVATDPHCLPYDFQRTISDKFFNMQLFYSQGKDIYLPYAFDAQMCYPDNTPKTADAVLIGMPYDNRVKWINELRSRGVTVLFENGPIFDEYRNLNNHARIGLNWSSLNDLNCRVFELMAMKLCPVINRVPDLKEFFVEGRDYIGFDNLQEAVDGVAQVMNNPDRINEIAGHAYETVQPHTYDQRVKQILVECGFE